MGKMHSDLGRVHGLRRGYTTGTCAQAAAKGAAIMLIQGRTQDHVQIELPGGKQFELPLIEQELSKDYARCAVIKDSGDDPDITDGVVVVCEIRFTPEPGITIKGGHGVGTVTKPGLAVPVGESAINPVPRKMIIKELTPMIPADCGLEVTISVPEGEALAEKTWNPRLGICGGISIIGTTGIVEPKSTSAYKASIALSIKVAISSGQKSTLFLAPGYIGEKLLKETFRIPEEIIIKIGDHVGFSLKHCEKMSVSRVVLIGHIGKLVKVAAGIFNTHSRYADARLETIAAYAASAGADSVLVRELLGLKLAEASVQILKENNLMEAVYRIAEAVVRRCRELTGNTLEIGTAILALDGEILACFPRKLTEKKEWFTS